MAAQGVWRRNRIWNRSVLPIPDDNPDRHPKVLSRCSGQRITTGRKVRRSQFFSGMFGFVPENKVGESWATSLARCSALTAIERFCSRVGIKRLEVEL
jgi:hypothetical protein